MIQKIATIKSNFSKKSGYVHAVGEQLSSTDFNYISCEDCFIPCDKILIKARKYLDLSLLIKKILSVVEV